MNIDLRILMQEDAVAAARQTGDFSEDELSAIVFTLDAGSERLDSLLEATRNASGIWFNPGVNFTKKELDSAPFLQLECRKTLPESSKDMAWNERHIESLALRTTSADMEIRLPDRIAVSKVAKLHAHMVAGVGELLQEFVVHTAVAAAFETEGLGGWSLRPVFDSRTDAAHDNVKQLYSESLMPPALLDRTTPPSDDGGVRQLGCLVYEDAALDGLPDFNRTAEDWAAREMPLWVVSQRTRECFQRNKFRGWAFRPVLVSGSELHSRYQAMWAALFDKVAINPRNFF